MRKEEGGVPSVIEGPRGCGDPRLQMTPPISEAG